MTDPLTRIEQNLADLRGRIAVAAARAGRAAEEITLVGVTKYVGAEDARALVEAGCGELGESRPQVLWEKAESLTGCGARWHLIGHLQRNKVRRTLPVVSMIQSVDSRRLIEALDAEASAANRRVRMLLEVNVSGDSSKHGFPPGEMPAVVRSLAGLAGVEVRGLMTMAGRTTGAEGARRDFAALRELRDRLRPLCPDGVVLDELSMGMSGDFETAIEEGATIVRVGSALFEV